MVARLLRDLRVVRGRRPRAAAERRGRGVGPRLHDALRRRHRRRRRDPAAGGLLPLGERARSTPRSAGCTRTGTRRHHHRGRGPRARRRSSRTSADRLYLRDLVDQVPTPASAGHYAAIVSQGRAAPPADLRRRRRHGDGLLRRRRGRAGRRRGRAADLRRRAARGQGGDGHPPRPRRPGDDGPRVDPEPRLHLHGHGHRVPRPRRPHVGAAAGQPHRDRGAAGHRQVARSP